MSVLFALPLVYVLFFCYSYLLFFPSDNAGEHSYTLAVNEFADLTADEFSAKMTGLNVIQNDMMASANSEGPHNYVEAPLASLDWRQRKAVTPVKNQASCGSCWAFSATGSVEGAYAIKTGKLVTLSEQELVDCSRPQGNHGCNGGLMDQAFEWIIKNKGITSESAYPYTAKDGTCKPGSPVAATISKYVNVQVK
jgi:C1A family cysteine protease